MHFVLIGLDRYAAERCIGTDIVRLSEIAMTGREAIMEKLQEVNLTAGLGEHIEIFIMDMYIAINMRSCDILWQDVMVNEVLGAFRPIF